PQQSTPPRVAAPCDPGFFFALGSGLFRPLGEYSQERLRIGVVAEGLVKVNEQIAIFGSKDEASTQLERILSKPVLLESCCFGNRSCLAVVSTENVQQVCRLQFRSFVRDPLGIHQKRKGNAHFLAKDLGVAHVAKPDSRKSGSSFSELVFMFAQ